MFKSGKRPEFFVCEKIFSRSTVCESASLCGREQILKLFSTEMSEACGNRRLTIMINASLILY